MLEFLATAITGHMAWRGRLMTAAQNRRPPDAAATRSDCNRTLGKCLYGEGKHHCRVPEYDTLLKRHKKFHQVAASVVDHINADRISEAKASLVEGDFRAQSRVTIEAIDDLRYALSGKSKARRPWFDAVSIRSKAVLGA